jgi:hypothetical protein
MLRMEIEQDFEGETYEVEVRLEDKDRLRHIAQYPIKNGPRTFKYAHVFEVKASNSGRKIIHFWKSRLTEEGSFEVEEESRFECNQDELEKLAAFLDHIEDIAGLERGEYIFLKKDEPSSRAALAAIDSIKRTESDEVEDIIIKLLHSIGEFEIEEEEIESIGDNLTSDVVDVENLIGQARTKKVVSDFEELISQEKREHAYQEFLEENPWLFGNRYIDLEDTRRLTRDEEVDFCLETVDGYYDVFEIKRPVHSVVEKDRSHDTYYPSSKLSKAVGQVSNYLKYIDNEYPNILSRDGLDMIRPRGNIIIGSDLSEDEIEGLRVYNNHLNRIRVITYDQVVKMGNRLIDVYS